MLAERTRNHTKFARSLNDLEPEELMEAAKQVAVTMQTPGWGLIVGLLVEQKDRRLDDLVRREGVRTEAEYAAVLAEARGIQLALDAGQTVLDKAKAARDELIRQQGMD